MYNLGCCWSSTFTCSCYSVQGKHSYCMIIRNWLALYCWKIYWSMWYGPGWTMLKVKNLSYITKGALSLSHTHTHTHTRTHTHTHAAYCTNISVFNFTIFHTLCLPSLIIQEPLWTYQVYLERILRKPEIDAFSEELKAHQVINVFSTLLLMLHSLDVMIYNWCPFAFSTESTFARQFHCSGSCYDWAQSFECKQTVHKY